MILQVNRRNNYNNILVKNGHLDDIEWIEVLKHPVKGSELAQILEYPPITVRMIKDHHERRDNKGYQKSTPCLYGEKLHLLTRYTAMTNQRPYPGSSHVISPQESYEIILKDNGLAHQGLKREILHPVMKFNSIFK